MRTERLIWAYLQSASCLSPLKYLCCFFETITLEQNVVCNDMNDMCKKKKTRYPHPSSELDWTHHKTQTWAWKYFPCFIFSLAVTSYFSCFVWWLLLPCLIKLFKCSLPDKAGPLADIHAQTVHICVVSVRQGSSRGAEAHTDTTKRDNDMAPLAPALYKMWKEICWRSGKEVFDITVLQWTPSRTLSAQW